MESVALVHGKYTHTSDVQVGRGLIDNPTQRQRHVDRARPGDGHQPRAPGCGFDVVGLLGARETGRGSKPREGDLAPDLTWSQVTATPAVRRHHKVEHGCACSYGYVCVYV